MKTKSIFFYLLLLFFSGSVALQAQEEGEKMESEFSHHQLGVLLAHTNLRDGNIDSDKNRITVPSYTIFYNYRFNEKWMLGLHTDIVFEQFITQPSDEEAETIERERPIAPAIMVGYALNEHFTFLVGGGWDIDKEETLNLIRFDLEYGLEIRNGWEFGATFGYDARIDAFDSFQIGVGISKNF